MFSPQRVTAQQAKCVISMTVDVAIPMIQHANPAHLTIYVLLMVVNTAGRAWKDYSRESTNFLETTQQVAAMVLQLKNQRNGSTKLKFN